MLELEKLISSFRFGHQSILDSLEQIQSVIRSYPQAKPKISDLQDKLLNHLSHQNKNFYNLLSTCFQNDRQACKTIESLEKDLVDTKVQTLDFFERYPSDMTDHHSASFPLDFTVFSKFLKARLQLEQDYLLPLLEKMSQ